MPNNISEKKPVANIQTDNFICENCGGTMKWNISKQTFECSACRTPGTIKTIIQSVQENQYDALPARRARLGDANVTAACVTCSNCGAEVMFDETQTATLCPMCGSSQVSLERQKSGIPPDGIIPFKVDKADAQESFKKWVKTRWFAPNRLKEAYQQGKLEGIYLPFWTFDAQAYGIYSGRGGEVREYEDSKGEKHTRTDWHPVSGEVSNEYDDIQICATEQKAADIVTQVLPYNTSSGSLPFSSAYLSGFGAERYSVETEDGFNSALKEIERDLKTLAEQQIRSRGYDVADVQSITVRCNNVTYKHIITPAWLSAFSYSGKQYLYMINGETGAVGGNRPYSIPKIVAAVIVAAILVLGLTYFFGDDEEDTGEYNNKDTYVETYDNTAQENLVDNTQINAVLEDYYAEYVEVL